MARMVKNITIGSILAATVLYMQAPQLLAARRQDNIPTSGSNASLNWAGYAASGGPFTAVTGSWVVPTIASQGTAEGRADATWVGIGGVHSNDLIQAGTQAIVGRGGSVSYEAWYETLPNVSMPVSLTVSPGDSITTTLTQTSPSEWRVSIHDNTTGGEFDKMLIYNSSLSSAEWVEERVSDVDGSFWPLDNFGSVKFFNAFATVGGQQEDLSQMDALPITMVNGAGQVLASTSPVDGQTGTFTVARADTAASPVPSYAAVSPGISPEPEPASSSPGAQYVIISFGPGGISVTQNGVLTSVSHHRKYR